MTVVTAVCAALALLLALPASRDPAARLRGPGTPARRRSRARDPRATAGVRRPVVVLGVVGSVLLLLAGVSRWVLLAAVAAGLAAVRRGARVRAWPELPLTLDLLAASLRGGALLPAGLEVAATAAGGGLGERLLLVAGALRAGADEPEAWAAATVAARPDPDLAAVARICSRTAASGAATAAELERLARRLRLRRRSELDAGAARAGVWVVLPLCLCFLPAFVLTGVVPLAVGLLGSVR